jgi:AraC-like DNA-binding protein
VKLERFFPSPALAPFIREFLIIESDLAISSNAIPDTSVVMAFRYKGNVQRAEGERKESIPASVISGIRKSSRIFHYSPATANLLVLFKEGGIHAFTKIPAHELFGISVPTENIFYTSELDEVIERLAEANTHKDRIDIIEKLLLKKITGHTPDLLIGDAIRTIKQRNGIIRIKDLAASLYISQDAFEKRFRNQAGCSPKQFASIFRLRNLIRKYSSYPSLTDASYEAGYFDQSHFIKDFRLFTGHSPKEFFRSFQYW